MMESVSGAITPKYKISLYSSTTSTIIGGMVQFDAYLSRDDEPVYGKEIELKDENGEILDTKLTDRSGHAVFVVPIRNSGKITVYAEAKTE